MASYRLTDDAEADLILIFQFGVRRFGAHQAESYFHALIERFQEIAQFPLSYPLVDDLRDSARRSVFQSSSIYYDVHDDAIEIIAILGQQDRNLRI